MISLATLSPIIWACSLSFKYSGEVGEEGGELTVGLLLILVEVVGELEVETKDVIMSVDSLWLFQGLRVVGRKSKKDKNFVRARFFLTCISSRTLYNSSMCVYYN